MCSSGEVARFDTIVHEKTKPTNHLKSQKVVCWINCTSKNPDRKLFNLYTDFTLWTFYLSYICSCTGSASSGRLFLHPVKFTCVYSLFSQQPGNTHRDVDTSSLDLIFYLQVLQQGNKCQLWDGIFIHWPIYNLNLFPEHATPGTVYSVNTCWSRRWLQSEHIWHSMNVSALCCIAVNLCNEELLLVGRRWYCSQHGWGWEDDLSWSHWGQLYSDMSFQWLLLSPLSNKNNNKKTFPEIKCMLNYSFSFYTSILMRQKRHSEALKSFTSLFIVTMNLTFGDEIWSMLKTNTGPEMDLFALILLPIL